MKDFQLGPWKVYPELNSIAGENEVRIEPQVMKVLCHLASRPGRAVSKEELIQEVWQGRFVGDEVITTSIWELRKALGDNARQPTFIQTIPKRGYRLIAEVRPLTAADGEAAASKGSGRIARRPAAAAGLLAATLLAAAWLWLPQLLSSSDADSPQQLAIAVLPFREMDGSAYFGRGLSEALAGELARLPYLRILAAESVNQSDSESTPLRETARNLGAGAVIQGNVQREAAHVRLNLQLVDPGNGQLLWSQAFRQMDSLLPLLILEAAQKAAQELPQHFDHVPAPSPELLSELEEQRRKPAVGRQAYENYLRGLYFWRIRKKAELHQAVELFESAIAQSPDYAQAYAGLANAHLILADHLHAPSETSLTKAHEAAQKALRLDPQSPEALTAMAWIAWVRDWDWTGAERLFRQALRINPSYSTGHQWFSAMLEVAGKTEEAAFHASEAQRLDVLSPIVHTTAGMVAWTADRLEESEECFRKAIQLDPDFFEAHKGLFWQALQRDDTEAAASHCRRVQRYVRENDVWSPYTIRFHLEGACESDRIATRGLSQEDFRYLAEGLREREMRGFVSPLAWMELHASAGHAQEARRWLQASILSRSRHVFYLPKYLEVNEETRVFDDPLVKTEMERIPIPLEGSN